MCNINYELEFKIDTLTHKDKVTAQNAHSALKKSAKKIKGFLGGLEVIKPSCLVYEVKEAGYRELIAEFPDVLTAIM